MKKMIKVIKQNEFDEMIKSEECVIVDFFATWCGPCKTMSRVIEDFSEDHPEQLILKVDVDENKELANRFSVMSIPTLLFVKNGDVVKVKSGVMSATELEDTLEAIDS